MGGIGSSYAHLALHYPPALPLQLSTSKDFPSSKLYNQDPVLAVLSSDEEDDQ
jgi:hypothetical protein